jgi:hypothetical protein
MYQTIAWFMKAEKLRFGPFLGNGACRHHLNENAQQCTAAVLPPNGLGRMAKRRSLWPGAGRARTSLRALRNRSQDSCTMPAGIDTSGINQNEMRAPPAASVNDINHSIPISYATHVRYSPGLHRTCTGPAPAVPRADRGTHSRIANVVSRAISEPSLRNRV